MLDMLVYDMSYKTCIQHLYSYSRPSKPVFCWWRKTPQATPQTWCQKIVDENQELLIGDLTICEEEKDAFIFDTSLAIHSL